MVSLNNFFKKTSLYFYTLRDVGLFRIIKRIIYNLKNFLNKLFLKRIINKYSKSTANYWISMDFYPTINKSANFKIRKNKFQKFSFNINNQICTFNSNSVWSGPYPSRLWQFNLNYFNWAIYEFFEYSKSSQIDNIFYRISFLIDSWIKYNSENYNDGWHSYTTSIRIRNWIWMFRFVDELANNQRLNSLWIQIYWLYKNQECYLGGNHYLENLISLVIASLNFSGKQADKIFIESLENLKNQLDEQILKDGGHYEGSTSYHLSLLESLVLTGLWIRIFKKNVPKWLDLYIKKMSNWSLNVLLNGSNYPRFNDSIYDKEVVDIKNIIQLSKIYLNQDEYLKGHNSKFEQLNYLLRNYKSLNFCDIDNLNEKSKKTDIKISNLPETGWTILKPNINWEIVFKSGFSAPSYLPGHSHSDVGSFDIFYKGNPIIVETGTSRYENSYIRNYERSGIAHNIIQFTNQKNINFLTYDDWSEPLEVWDSFRVGRKVKLISSSYGCKEENTLWAECSYQPIEKYLRVYTRTIYCKLKNNDSLFIEIKDQIISNTDLIWRINFHLAQNQSESILFDLYENNNSILDFQWVNSWTSYNFEERYNSKSLFLYGSFKKGYNVKSTSFLLKTN